MRILGLLLATLAITNVVAQDSFCVKYAKAVFNKTDDTLTGTDEWNLISAVVGRVVVGCNNNLANQYGVPGVDPNGPFGAYKKSACNSPNAAYTTKPAFAGLVSDVTNAPFFNGEAPNYQSLTGLQSLNTAAGIPLANSIRFLNVSGFDVTPNPAVTGVNTTTGYNQGLIQHLVSYFGRALQCRYYNNVTANGIGAYQGNDNMKAVHANMNITLAVWEGFRNSFTDTLASFGVSQADIIVTIRPFFQSLLLGAPQQICNDPWSCPCAPVVNGQPYIKVGNECVLNTTATASPTTAAPVGNATTAPPTTAAPVGNGTTSPPTGTGKSDAYIIQTSMATMLAAVAVLLLAFL